jgi:hypothetical protein
MGIDQEIQRRMDAYRGNPQGLQQRYQMSQQLIDLLALQKLKAEQDAMARQMQAQMQQTPGTVAQQMEQEMLGRTKQEVAQQVGGVMQQQARQQQQNMARMAQAAARPQGGIGSLAPQTARMAGGGIVAFASGGTKEDAELRARVETAMKLGASQEDLANLLSRIGKSPEEFGLDALVPSQPRQMAAAEAPGAEGLRFKRPSASSTLAAIEAIPTAAVDTPMPMSVAEQAEQALARGPQVTPPVAGSLMAPPSEEGPRPEAGALVGTPFEQRSQLKDQINDQLKELNVRRLRLGSERFLPEERKRDFAQADALRRNLAVLQAAGNDPDKVEAAVRYVERRVVGGDVERIVDRARGEDRDIDARLDDPMFAVAAAEEEAAPQKDTVDDVIEAIGGQRVASAGAGLTVDDLLPKKPPAYPGGPFPVPGGPQPAPSTGAASAGGAPPPPASGGSITPGSVTSVTMGGPGAATTPITVPAAATTERLGRLGDLYEGIAGEDLSGVEAAAAKRAREGYSGIVSGMERRLKDYQAGMAKEFKPEDERLDRLIAFALGAGNQATGAGALGAGGKAAMQLRGQQRTARMARNKEILQAANNIDLTKIGIEKDVQARASDAITRATSRVNSAMQAASTISAAERRAADAAATLALQGMGLENQRIQGEIANDIAQARRLATERTATANERRTAIAGLSAQLEVLNQMDAIYRERAALTALSPQELGEYRRLTNKAGLGALSGDEAATFGALEKKIDNATTSMGSAGGFDVNQQRLDILSAIQDLSR